MATVRTVSPQQFIGQLHRAVTTHASPKALAVRNQDVPPTDTMPAANVYFSYNDGGRQVIYWQVQKGNKPLSQREIAELIVRALPRDWFAGGNKAANYTSFIARRHPQGHWMLMNFIDGRPLLGSYE